MLLFHIIFYMKVFRCSCVLPPYIVVLHLIEETNVYQYIYIHTIIHNICAYSIIFWACHHHIMCLCLRLFLATILCFAMIVHLLCIALHIISHHRLLVLYHILLCISGYVVLRCVFGSHQIMCS